MNEVVAPASGSVVLGGTLLGRLRAPFADPTVDPRVRQARLGASLYLLAALVGSVTVPFLPRSVSHGWMWVLALSAVLAAVTMLVLPWSRWSGRAILVPLTLGPCMIGVGIGGLAHGLLYYLPLYALSFVFAGVTQRPGVPTAMAPLSLAAGCTGLLTGESADVFIPLVIMIGVSTMLGELIARYVQVQRIAGDTLDELLMGVAGLTGCRTVSEASDLGSAVVCRLLGADIAMVLLPDTEGSPSFQYAGGVGIPDETNEATRGRVVVDGGDGPSGTALAAMQRRLVFVPDAQHSALVANAWFRESGMSSVLYLPLMARPGVVAGVAIATFRRPRRSVDAITTRGLNLLAEATGRVIGQLRQSEQLAKEAETDPLTGLHNRRVFFRELASMEPGDAVVFLDLDHFKVLNDTLGHAAGDRELAAFGAVLREQVRDTDHVARYGGEEFAVLVRGHGRSGAEHLVQRLREAWQRSSATTFSVGAALHQDGRQPNATLAAADRAVYAAKAAGRNRLCWADGAESYPAGRVTALGQRSHRSRRDGDVATA